MEVRDCGHPTDRRRFIQTLVLGTASTAVPGSPWQRTAIAALTPVAPGQPGQLRLRIADFAPLVGGAPFASVRISLTGPASTGTRITGLIQPLLVSRDGDAFNVLTAKCTHEGCILPAFGTNRTTTCQCHSSRFSSTGTRLAGPASASLNAYTITSNTDGILSVEIPELDAFDMTVTQVILSGSTRLALGFDSVRSVEYQVLAREAVEAPWEVRMFATQETGVLTQTVFKGNGNPATLYVAPTGDRSLLAIAVRVR